MDKHNKLRNELLGADGITPNRVSDTERATFKRMLKQKLPSKGRWRINMSSRTFRVAIAAVILLALGLTIYTLTGSFEITGRVYAAADIPELIKTAKTMHIRGWFYLPASQQSSDKVNRAEFEHWFDIESGRFRSYKPGSIDENTGKPKYFTSISDGEFLLSESHRRSINDGVWVPEFTFTRLSPFQARLEAYKASIEMIQQMFGNLDQMEGSTQIGRETINGANYDIWQIEFFLADGRGTRIKTWLNPDSGQIGRILFWFATQQKTPDWQLLFEIDTLELDIIPPAGIFDAIPPEDAVVTNSKEAARLKSPGFDDIRIEDYALYTCIGFTLDDGSVLLAWACPNKQRTSQASLFESLIWGGPLPKLAGIISGLKVIPGTLDLQYTGYHIASSEREGIHYEWALYVQDQNPPVRNSLLGYEFELDLQVSRDNFDTLPRTIVDDIPINSSDDFNVWVRGAMAWLSDDGEAPAEVTYERVLELAEQIRNSYNP